MADALGIATALMDEPPAAWKLGGTNTATRAIFDVDAPYFGPLRAQEVFESDAVLNKADYPSPLLAEPEIAIAFGRDFPPAAVKRPLEEIADAIDWVAPAIELPATVLSDPSKAGVNWLVADRCAAGALVIGTRLSPAELGALERADIAVAIDGAPAPSRQNGLVGGVLGTLQDMLAVFTDHDIALPKGVVIATGGLAPAINVHDAQKIEARFGAHVVGLSLANAPAA